jgi:acyl dehydratase
VNERTELILFDTNSISAEERVILHSFSVPAERRFFEDYQTGQEYEFGPVTVSERDIIEFARQFDPQDFHVDPVKAASGPFGGIVASGWHTISVAMRLYVDHYLSHVASLGSPGVDEVRWPAPVRPGDSLKLRVRIMETRPSRSKPERGIVRAQVEAVNQRGEVVLSMTVVSFLGRRR